ncbi:hypothetical protein KP509_02G084100 [Ceratopteris richardii]|nr:hypothetical protein KP509_02G084100 [Ceratopteris richardii]KAH7444584.1 hypothetical protein KP509_02G084100 [Ceratopteris richardii]KAH7444585.1 hypothetical protein KP509_02G084100 [Ceratopteris richardii]
MGTEDYREECLSVGDVSLCSPACDEECLSAQPEVCMALGDDPKGSTLTDKVSPKVLEQVQTISHGHEKNDFINICFPEAESSKRRRTLNEVALLNTCVGVQVESKTHEREDSLGSKHVELDELIHSTTAHASQHDDDLVGCKTRLEMGLQSHDNVLIKRIQNDVSSVLAGESTELVAIGENCRVYDESMSGGSSKLKVAGKLPKHLGAGNGHNDLNNGHPSPLLPNSVIQAIGQLQFWKVRLTLLRQQRIFSDQVFELHKLIEVQRLLAGNPDVSINEVYFSSHGNMIIDYEKGDHFSVFNDGEACIQDALGTKVSASEALAKALIVAKGKCKLQTESKDPLITEYLFDKGNAWKPPSSGPKSWAAVAPVQTGFNSYTPLHGGLANEPVLGVPYAFAVQGDGPRVFESPSFPHFPICMQKPICAPSAQSSQEIALASGHHQPHASHKTHFSVSKASNHLGPFVERKQSTHEAPSVLRADKDKQMRATFSCPVSSHVQDFEKDALLSTRALSMFETDTKNVVDTSRGSHFSISNMGPCNEKQNYSKDCEQAAGVVIQRNNTLGKERADMSLDLCKEQGQSYEITRGQNMMSSNSYMNALSLLPLAPTSPSYGFDRGLARRGKGCDGHVIKVVPRTVKSAPDSTASILLSLQNERRQ